MWTMWCGPLVTGFPHLPVSTRVTQREYVGMLMTVVACGGRGGGGGGRQCAHADEPTSIVPTLAALLLSRPCWRRCRVGPRLNRARTSHCDCRVSRRAARVLAQGPRRSPTGCCRAAYLSAPSPAPSTTTSMHRYSSPFCGWASPRSCACSKVRRHRAVSAAARAVTGLAAQRCSLPPLSARCVVLCTSSLLV